MKVLALTRTSSIGPSTRYRIEQYRPLLAQRGIEIETAPLFDERWFAILERPPGLARLLAKARYSLGRLAARCAQARSASRSNADVVLVEQQLFPYLPAAIELALWPRAPRTIIEMDDAIYLTRGHRAKLQRLWAAADLVIVGNRFLADVVRPFAKDLAIIPTTVDVSRYDEAWKAQRKYRATRPKDAPLRVGWVGLRYNFPFLQLLAEPLARIAASGRQVELRVISSSCPEPGPQWGDVKLVHRPWSSKGEASEIGCCDLGVMPLPDNEWSRGKCALKLLQYMAAGLPVVASPVGVNADLVQHGVNGLLAGDSPGWEASVGQLADDAELRASLGEAGRQTVISDFSLGMGAEMVAKAYGFASPNADGKGVSF
ncbi:MAG: glycosyltransferase involved in cell wall biosynthesis [Pseudohongiellaceae bacterium]|jgi:glycosyltransferase involved in cell wall biosynthesis